MSGSTFVGHTPTAFTEEDIYYARKVYFDKDKKCDAITFVTSQFHMKRVTEIAKMVFRDCKVEFLESEDGADISHSDRDSEPTKLALFHERWVESPLYVGEDTFPAEVYENAMEEHKHSDTVSLALATGAFVVSAYPHTTIKYSDPSVASCLMLIACGHLGFVLFMLYLRFSKFAFMARMVMRGLELGWCRPGFSYNHDRHFDDRFPEVRNWRTATVLSGMMMFLYGANWIAALVLWFSVLSIR